MREKIRNNLIIIAVALVCIALIVFSGIKQSVMKNNRLPEVIAEAERLLEGYYYDEALQLIEESGYPEEKTAEITVKNGKLLLIKVR